MPLLKEDDSDNTRILTNVAIIVSIMLLLCYAVPYVYNITSDNMEDSVHDNERSNTKDNWDIVKEVHSIRERQKQNINKMSQISSYGI